MNDVLGNALTDYNNKTKRNKLWIHNTYGKKEQMPISSFFRGYDEMTELEHIALEACAGKTLDVGAAAGSNALILQQRKLNVTAIDISPGACHVMQQRGVKKVIHEDIYNYKKQRFYTVLFLMNGMGVAQTIDGLKQLLIKLKSVLQPGGQIIFDSSDVGYLYNDATRPQHYYGEISYMYEYKKKHSGWFKWLYVDQQLMKEIAAESGYIMEILLEDNHQQYLARMKQA